MTVNIGQLAASTLRARSGKTTDNISNNIALWKYIKEAGNDRFEDGGRDILEEVELAEQNFQWYDDWDTINVSPVDHIDSAVYDWRQAAASMSISGKQARMNSGKHASIKLVKSKVKNLEKTMLNNLSIAIESDGTGSNGLQMVGLKLLVSTTPSTGTVAGIDTSLAANAFWRNYAFSGVSNGGAAVSAVNIQSYMNSCWLATFRPMDKNKFWTMDNNYYQFYWESLQAIQRITSDTKRASAGFESLAYKGNVDVICNGGLGGSANANQARLLCADYFHLVTHPEADMAIVGGDRTPVNQDGFARIMLFMGALTMSNRQVNAVLYA